jgi:hypothetical protein
MNPVNKCHSCGSTSYKNVIDRDEKGAMRSTGKYQCTSCQLVFGSVEEWRGTPEANVPKQKSEG